MTKGIKEKKKGSMSIKKKTLHWKVLLTQFPPVEWNLHLGEILEGGLTAIQHDSKEISHKIQELLYLFVWLYFLLTKYSWIINKFWLIKYPVTKIFTPEQLTPNQVVRS